MDEVVDDLTESFVTYCYAVKGDEYCFYEQWIDLSLLGTNPRAEVVK